MINPALQNADLPYVDDLAPGDLRALQQEAAAIAGVPTEFRDPMAGLCEAPPMVVIPAGMFSMGSQKDEFGHQAEEAPQHYVFIEKAFAIGKYTITAEEFDQFRHETGWYLRPDLIWPKGRYPAMNMDVGSAQAFTSWLSGHTGQVYRLPTEAEWEYAARAGESGPFAFGDSVTCREVHFNSAFPYAEAREGRKWWVPRCMPLTRALMVGHMQPNHWGLHDMHGNVWEFTSSPWTRSHIMHRRDGRTADDSSEWIVTKGGSWFDGAVRARSAARNPRLRVEIDINLGFRVVREFV